MNGSMVLSFPKRIAAVNVYKHPFGTVDLTPTVMALMNRPSTPQSQGDLSAKLAANSKANKNNADQPSTFLRTANKNEQPANSQPAFGRNQEWQITSFK